MVTLACCIEGWKDVTAARSAVKLSDSFISTSYISDVPPSSLFYLRTVNSGTAEAVRRLLGAGATMGLVQVLLCISTLPDLEYDLPHSSLFNAGLPV